MIVDNYNGAFERGGRRLYGYGGFGSVSPVTQGQCPAGTSEAVWCDCMWPVANDPAMNAKCKQPAPWYLFGAKPWTAAGAAARGIPFTGDVSLPGGAAPAAGAAGGPVVAGAQNTIFGIPKTIAYVGGGVLGLGVLAMLLGGKKKSAGSVAGYSRKRKRRSKKGRR
jgi:hypothetical protein